MCQNCIGGRCHDEPKPESAVLVKCPICEGTGTAADKKTKCEHCQDGDFELTQCPYQYVGHYAELSQLCHLWTENGIPPVAGGVLDQTAYFVNAQRTFAAQKNAINAKELPDVGRR
jgi:hypothetical protein